MAADDANGLFAGDALPFYDVVRLGVAPNHDYEVVAGAEDEPVNYVSVFDAMRFVNWLENGQPVGAQDASTTEDGSYTITPSGVSANDITRNSGANFRLPNVDEWYKAAYYDVSTASFFDSPAGSLSPIGCAPVGASPNTANCGDVVGEPATVGGYVGSPGPSGQFDLGGNVAEWTEAIGTLPATERLVAGGGYLDPAAHLEAPLAVGDVDALSELSDVGIRVAPEPGFGLLIGTGLLCVAASTRRSRPRRKRALNALHARI